MRWRGGRSSEREVIHGETPIVFFDGLRTYIVRGGRS
jgi:hypothetical protein